MGRKREQTRISSNGIRSHYYILIIEVMLLFPSLALLTHPDARQTRGEQEREREETEERQKKEQ